RIGRNLVPRLRSPRLADHAAGLYALAARETAEIEADEDSIWLSLIVPVYNAPRRYLNDLLKSVRMQGIAGVELILSDDASSDPQTRKWLAAAQECMADVTLVLNRENGGIAAALNAGLAQARGEWIGFLDHDDLVAPHALKLIRKALDAHPDAAFLYTDELVVDDRLRPKGYMLKPAYDPILLTGVNYINHLSVFRRSRLERIGFLRAGYDGSQDYDLLLRYLRGVPDEAVLHLPYPAYWWRRNGKTYSRRFIDKATANARRALSDHMRVRGVDAEIGPALTATLHRIAFTERPVPPRVSIVIPNKNAYRLVKRVLQDLFERTDYPDFEVLVIDNGSDDRAVLDLYEHYRGRCRNFSADVRSEPFNFARAVNRGLSQASGEHFLLLNNDIEVIHPDWLTEMVSCLNYDRAGIVGAKLLYPNGTLQHAGVIAGFGGLAGHWYLDKPGTYAGPMNRLHVRASMTCVTGAAMLIAGECRRAVGDFDATNFAVAYNDVDYCLRAHKQGFRIVWTPFASLYHHESASRGSEKSVGNRVRFEAEKANLRRIHATADFADPAASPLNGRSHSTPKLKRIDRLPPARTWR
ncbi:MAG TPA: glycosyltransferase family 2 protein, partial [Pararhizobium sp.]|nr:glycosyltransferase family 2 protein [Pararhizobium sp.]